MHKALGKGIEALIPQTRRAKSAAQAGGIAMLPIDNIVAGKHQPRVFFDDEKISELADSIRKHGLAQPILVTPSIVQNEYELIAGERRLRACRKAGLTEIPAIIKQVDEKQGMELSLVENIQREDLNPIEQAQAFSAMMSSYNLTQVELAEMLALSRPYVANALRLLTLPARIREYIASNRIPGSQARALVGIDNEKLQHELAERILREKLTTREVERLALDWRQGIATKRVRLPRRRSPDLVTLEETLQRALGTKVNIKPGRKGGWVQVAYYSAEDLERILGIIHRRAKR